MGGNGKHKWRFSFHRSSNPKQAPNDPPKEFLCPITGSLMADPVVVSSGQTFELVSAQICRKLGFSPILEDGSKPDFSAIIPNLAIKTTIFHWCDKAGVEHPRPPDHSFIEKLVRSSMTLSASSSRGAYSEPQIRVSEMELLQSVADSPPMIFSQAVTELNPRTNHFHSSSSEESVIVTASPPTPLPLATRPACYSSSSSTSEIVESEAVVNEPRIPNPGLNLSEEEELAAKMKSQEIFEQEEAVILLRKVTRTKEEMRVGLCTPRLLAGLRPLIVSRYSIVQTNAIAALVNLSLEKLNKVKIVRAGFVPLIVDVLKGGFSESQEHAAGALFSLALDEENKMAIGVLGSLPPLMHALRSESERTRNDAALALYHLTLVQSNRTKLVKLGAVPTLLTMAQTGSLASRVLLVLCNLATCTEGRSAMLDGNAVAIFVGMLRRKELNNVEPVRENLVASLYALSHGSLRFKGLAKEARALEVLREVEERGSERAREKAKRILETLKGREEMEEVDWDSVLESGGFSRNRFRVGASAAEKDIYGANPNSTDF